MRSARWSILVLVSSLALLVACGSSGDDDDDSENDTSDEDGETSQRDGDSSDVEIPDVKSGAYRSGSVKIEITGDKDIDIEADGNGFAQEGFALLSYQSSDANVQIALSTLEGEPPGAVSVTTSEVVTGGEWGTHCEITVEQDGGKITGEFSCEDVEAISPGSVDQLEVTLKGTFSAER